MLRRALMGREMRAESKDTMWGRKRDDMPGRRRDESRLYGENQTQIFYFLQVQE